jgi:hypothetical protein
MNTIVAGAMSQLAELAYGVYVETLGNLRSRRLASVEVMELADSTCGLESEALTMALCDYLVDAPQRPREVFHGVVAHRGPEQFDSRVSGANAHERRRAGFRDVRAGGVVIGIAADVGYDSSG